MEAIMGYQTDFSGQFTVEPRLEDNHRQYLVKFNQTRRVKRDANVTVNLPDPVRMAVGLPVGVEGGYFVGATGSFGQDHSIDIIDHNQPPKGQPGLWCQWTPNEDGDYIEWDEGEKFYEYIEWIKYLLEHFLIPWGYEINGEIKWSGEGSSDLGKIIIASNVVKVKYGVVSYR